MSLIDVVILILTIILIFVIVFFSWILPLIRHENIRCSSCPSSKKWKRALKNYRKENKKQECDCCHHK